MCCFSQSCENDLVIQQHDIEVSSKYIGQSRLKDSMNVVAQIECLNLDSSLLRVVPEHKRGIEKWLNLL